MATPEPGAAAGVGALHRSLAELVEESQQLRSDVRSAERARRRANLIALGTLALLSAFVIALLVIGWQNSQVINQSKKTNDLIADCTTPGGTCYAQSSRRTGDAVGDIIRAEIFMAQCARLYPGEVGPDFDRKLEACVYGRLAEAARKRNQATPSPSPNVAPSPVPSRVPGITPSPRPAGSP